MLILSTKCHLLVIDLVVAFVLFMFVLLCFFALLPFLGVNKDLYIRGQYYYAQHKMRRSVAAVSWSAVGLCVCTRVGRRRCKSMESASEAADSSGGFTLAGTGRGRHRPYSRHTVVN